MTLSWTSFCNLFSLSTLWSSLMDYLAFCTVDMVICCWVNSTSPWWSTPFLRPKMKKSIMKRNSSKNLAFRIGKKNSSRSPYRLFRPSSNSTSKPLQTILLISKPKTCMTFISLLGQTSSLLIKSNSWPKASTSPTFFQLSSSMDKKSTWLMFWDRNKIKWFTKSSSTSWIQNGLFFPTMSRLTPIFSLLFWVTTFVFPPSVSFVVMKSSQC